MNEPVWIEREDCLGFHEELLSRFGGLPGIRDKGLLESALNRPKQAFCYEKPSIFEMAAAYAHGIVKNHPFLDGITGDEVHGLEKFRIERILGG